MRPRISIRGSVRRLVRPSVRPSVHPWSVSRYFQNPKRRFFFVHFIREAYEHRRYVELHLYRKVCLFVRPSVHVKGFPDEMHEEKLLFLDFDKNNVGMP